MLRHHDYKLNARVHCLEERIEDKGGGHEKYRCVRTRLPDSLFDTVEDRQPFHRGTPLARCDAANHLRSVVEHPVRLDHSYPTGNALHDHPG